MKAMKAMKAMSKTSMVKAKASASSSVLAQVDSWGKPADAKAVVDTDDDMPLSLSLAGLQTAVDESPKPKPKSKPGNVKDNKTGQGGKELRDKQKAIWLEKQKKAGKLPKVICFPYIVF
jgi:hypothetical protein